MPSAPKPKLTHLAIFVRDAERMEDFYTRVMGLTITDRGPATSAPVEMIFMSSDPAEHHQFVLVTGRPDDAKFNVAQQMSFVVDSLDELRTMRDRVLAEDMKVDRTVTHGNAWSVYFKDPEDNLVEIYVHTPWHVPQPHSHPFDLSLPDDEILRRTEAHCREDAAFKPAPERRAEMARMMAIDA